MNNESKTSINIKEIPLDQRVSFRLQRIGTLLTTQAVSLLKQADGLTLNQWRLLSFLSERNCGSAHEAGRLGHIDKATMSRAAAQLLDRGLITSETSEKDRRAAVLRLTSEGREVVEAVAPMMISRQAELIGALSDAERKKLFRILDKLETAISKSEQGAT
ncbi:MarR family transcriptional regulator [Rhodobacteraceae bacterium F11138]|nr:MarR family transcriptional regulator [Rhodobacteraceae bacterium F11138]